MDTAVAAAAGALLVALLNEARARSRARAAAVERDALKDDLRQIALKPDRRAGTDEDAPH